MYLTLGAPSRSEPARTVVIPLDSGETVPDFPLDGFRLTDLGAVSWARVREGGSDTADSRVRGFQPVLRTNDNRVCEERRSSQSVPD